MKSEAANNQVYNFVSFLSLVFAMLIVLANWVAPKTISIFSITMGSNVLVFLLALVPCGILFELDGPKRVMQAIKQGLLFSVIAYVYGQATWYFPAPNYVAETNLQYHHMLEVSFSLIVALSVAYLMASLAYIGLAKQFREWCDGAFVKVRFLVSGMLALALYAVVFNVFCALFYGGVDAV